MRHADELRRLLLQDAMRMEALTTVAALGVEDCWLGAGMVRDAVWDHLHHLPPQLPVGDVDVVWFDARQSDEDVDNGMEQRLRVMSPRFDWSVKNQARMHGRNHDVAYHSVEDALRYWPETATAVAVRLRGPEQIDIIAPFGLEDLFTLCLRPTPRFQYEKRHIFDERIRRKRWLARYPKLVLQAD